MLSRIALILLLSVPNINSAEEKAIVVKAKKSKAVAADLEMLLFSSMEIEEQKDKALELSDNTKKIMQMSFFAVGSRVSVQQYLSTWKKKRSLQKAGLDPSLARSKKVTGFGNKDWEIADKGFDRSLVGFELMRLGISLAQAIYIIDNTRHLKIERTIDLLIKMLEASGQDIDSIAVRKTMVDARKLRDAGEEDWLLFVLNSINPDSTTAN